MDIEDSSFQKQHIEICERSFTKACDEMERLSLEYYRLDVQIREVSSERHMQKQHISARRSVHSKVGWWLKIVLYKHILHYGVALNQYSMRFNY